MTKQQIITAINNGLTVKCDNGNGQLVIISDGNLCYRHGINCLSHINNEIAKNCKITNKTYLNPATQGIIYQVIISDEGEYYLTDGINEDIQHTELSELIEQ